MSIVVSCYLLPVVQSDFDFDFFLTLFVHIASSTFFYSYYLKDIEGNFWLILILSFSVKKSHIFCNKFILKI